MSKYTVYWQPGCTSCLKVKEFLRGHGIGFASVNVREVDGAFEALAKLGARSVPVVARDDRFVHGQDLDALHHRRLPGIVPGKADTLQSRLLGRDGHGESAAD